LSCNQLLTTWAGKCPSCGEWNSIVEQTQTASSDSLPTELFRVTDLPKSHSQRLLTGIEEFDRVLGGDDPGIVAGSVILVAGSPGVGKSTLLLQVASQVKATIYFSAEESLEQIRLRLNRLNLERNDLRLASERDLSRILATAEREKPSLVVIDSVQTIYDETVAGTPGSVVQVKELCWRIAQFAKNTNTAFIIVGHVTKEGLIAGPKVLEHLVDVVLYLEGDRQTGLRLLRGEKNRYGATDEVGIWRLTSSGFETVDDPGKLFATLVGQDVPGRSLTIAMEGSRAFLVEIQALATKTSFGFPKRATQGIDLNRLNLLLAVMENRLSLPTSQYDIYINVVGGFQLKDPGVDVAVVGAVISALGKKIIPERLVLNGEVGLLGEVRPAGNQQTREKEAKRLKYSFGLEINSISQLASKLA